jgi:hypothetical protein
MILPTVILPGAQKSATTSLAHILSSHDNIYIGQRKEPHYYSRDNIFHDDIRAYQAFYSGHSAERVVIDASTSYLPVPSTPHRILVTLGTNVRFIIALRNPIDRIVSGFMQMKVNERSEFRSHILETLPENIDRMSLEDLLSFERRQIDKDAKLGRIKLKPASWGWGQFPFNYTYVSCYSNQIERYLSLFPDDCFLFLTFEEITESQQELKDKLAQFLNIDASRFSNLSSVRRNESRVASWSYALFAELYRRSLGDRLPKRTTRAIRRVAKQMLSKKSDIGFSPSIYNKLIDIFDPEICRTAKLTGLNLEAWRKHRLEER